MRVREVVLAYPDSRYEKHRRSLSYFVHCTVVSVSLSQADSRGNIFRESCLATRHQTSLAMATRLYLQAWSMKPQAALFISASLCLIQGNLSGKSRMSSLRAILIGAMSVQKLQNVFGAICYTSIFPFVCFTFIGTRCLLLIIILPSEQIPKNGVFPLFFPF